MFPALTPATRAALLHRLRSPLVLVAGLVTLVVAGVAALAFSFWPHGVTIVVVPADVPVTTAAGTRARSAADCDSCGLIESIRHTDPVTGLPIYAFTVRMRDGSARETTEATSGRWREGEGVLIIGGSKARAAELQNGAP